MSSGAAALMGAGLRQRYEDLLLDFIGEFVDAWRDQSDRLVELSYAENFSPSDFGDSVALKFLSVLDDDLLESLVVCLGEALDAAA